MMSSREVRMTRLPIYILLIITCGVLLIPFYWMVVTSLRHTSALYHFPPSMLLHHVDLSNYPKALQSIPFFAYLRNSVIISGANVLGALVSSPIVAYAFAKLQWRGRGPIFAVVLATLFLPDTVTLAPTFIIMHDLGWVGTYLPLIVPAFFSTAFNVFLLRQFFRGIPNSLSEAARIDGANHWTILWRILVPLSVPALAAIAIFTFIGTWDSFLVPLIYLTNPSMYTLSIGLYAFVTDRGTLWNQLMAAGIMFMVPMLIVFFFGQKAFMEGGIRTTGIRG